MHSLNLPTLCRSCVLASVLAAGLDASASIHTFAFYPPGRLGDGAAVLEKASKTDSRLLSLIPGVSPHFATSKRHKDFGKDLLSLGLACSKPLLLSLLLPGIFNGRQQGIWCVQHTEMEEKGQGLTPSPSSSPRPTGVQGPPGRSLCQRAGGGTAPSPHPRHPHTVLVPPSPLSHHTLWLAVGACPRPQEEVACPRGSWHSPQPCCLPSAAGQGRSRHRSPQHHVRELRASSLHALCAAFQACAVVRKGLFGV